MISLFASIYAGASGKKKKSMQTLFLTFIFLFLTLGLLLVTWALDAWGLQWEFSSLGYSGVWRCFVASKR